MRGVTDLSRFFITQNMEKELLELGFELDSTENYDTYIKLIKDDINIIVESNRIKVFKDCTKEILNQKYDIENLKKIIEYVQ